MAFMMPVVKNEFDIYNGTRSRKISECSNASSSCRSRKVSECRSECPSLSTSPGNEYISSPNSVNYNNNNNNYHRGQKMHRAQSRPFSRTPSRTSQGSFVMSPTKSSLQNPSPPKSATTQNTGSQNSLNKFHSRLIDKLRKSFRRDKSDDRS